MLSLCVEIDLGITGSSGSTAIDILDGHNSQKAADIRKLLQGLLLETRYCRN